MAWRDFFQNFYRNKEDEIFSDIKISQEKFLSIGIPTAVVKTETGKDILDTAIEDLYKTGYLHNHLRIYLASVCCNIGKFHWSEPAKWMYYHLLDGDLASNYLSWQWVAGTFSTKKYFANQENLNKYFGGVQRNTFLYVSYSDLGNLDVPEILRSVKVLVLETKLPEIEKPIINNEKTLVFNYYNLDLKWHSSENFQRVLLIEPSHFKRYPVSEKCMNFILLLGKNISELKVFVGEFEDLMTHISKENIHYKEHPTNVNYKGICEERKSLYKVEGEFQSFSSYWKKIKKGLQKDFEN